MVHEQSTDPDGIEQQVMEQPRMLVLYPPEDWQITSGRVRSGCSTKGNKISQPIPINQASILSHIRPSRWTGQILSMPDDALILVVNAMMLNGYSNALRALALVNHQFASIVRTAMLSARRMLLELATSYSDAAQSLYDVADELIPTCVTAKERLAVCKMHADYKHHCLCMYENCMVQVGIGEDRRNRLTTKPGSRWFHSSASILGHINGGCELCGSCESQDTRGAGGVAIFSCRACALGKRVRFKMHMQVSGFRRECLLIAHFPRVDSAANGYACALLSKHASHKRRMCASRASDAKNISLSRRVHHLDINYPGNVPNLWGQYETEHKSTDMWNTDDDEEYHFNSNRSLYIMQFELWHVLPLGIPTGMDFATSMGMHPNEETRIEALKHSSARKKNRAKQRVRCMLYNTRMYEYKDIVRDMRSIVRSNIAEEQVNEWFDVKMVCEAALATPMCWIFVDDESFAAALEPFEIRAHKFNIVLDMCHETVRLSKVRIQNVIEFIRARLILEGKSVSIRTMCAIYRDHNNDLVHDASCNPQ